MSHPMRIRVMPECPTEQRSPIPKEDRNSIRILHIIVYPLACHIPIFTYILTPLQLLTNSLPLDFKHDRVVPGFPTPRSNTAVSGPSSQFHPDAHFPSHYHPPQSLHTPSACDPWSPTPAPLHPWCPAMATSFLPQGLHLRWRCVLHSPFVCIHVDHTVWPDCLCYCHCLWGKTLSHSNCHCRMSCPSFAEDC